MAEILIPACRICKKNCLGNLKCDKCQCMFYCSEACKMQDVPEHSKICTLQEDDEKFSEGKKLQAQLSKSFSIIQKDLLFWKNTSSYKTGILTEFMVIHFQDSGAIVTAIAEIPETMKPKINSFWPQTNPKETIPIRIMNSKVNIVSRINLWPGF